MKNETLAVHGGYDSDPTTKAVAVPIYQTVAYEFDSADHGAALFNLEVEGHRYSRISNPTVAVLERRVAAAGRRHRRAVREHRPGGAELCRAQSHRDGHQYRLGAAALRHDPHAVRPRSAEPGHHRALCRVRPARRHRKADRRRHARHLLRKRRQSGRQYLRHRGAGRRRRAPRRSAGRRQHRCHADPAPPDRLRRRYRRAFADQIPRRPWHHARRRHRRQRQISLEEARRALPAIQRARRVLSRAGLCRSLRRCRLYRALPQRLSAHHRRGAVAAVRLPVAARHRNGGAAGRASCRECAPRRRISARSIRASSGSIMRALPTIPITRWRRNISAAAPVRCSLSASSAGSKPARHFTTRSSCSSGWSIWATPNRSPAIRPRPRIGRCRPTSSARPACGRK